MITINVKGPIITNDQKWIYDWLKMDATCPNDVINALPDDGSEVSVIINSGGGYVDAGNEIYTALKSYGGRVTVTVIKAASAASVIACAGDRVYITPVGQIMVHNASCEARGNHQVMDNTSAILQKIDRSIVNAYCLKTGRSKEELLAMMEAETWMTAEEAKENGFVDEILFQEEAAPALMANCEELLPSYIVLKMQEFKNSGQQDNDKSIDPSKLSEMIMQAARKAVNEALAATNRIEQDNKPTEPENNRFFLI